MEETREKKEKIKEESNREADGRGAQEEPRG